jgi:hypothetical protein
VGSDLGGGSIGFEGASLIRRWFLFAFYGGEFGCRAALARLGGAAGPFKRPVAGTQPYYITILGLVQTNEVPAPTKRGAPSGSVGSSTQIKIFKMFNNGQPLPTNFVAQPP